MRSTTRIIAPAAPWASYDGSRPMQKVDVAIRMSVITSTLRRPIRSPKWPRRKPPKGRAKKPTPKVAKENSSPRIWLPDGKNTGAKTSALARL
jgi:hypothetical protein